MPPSSGVGSASTVHWRTNALLRNANADCGSCATNIMHNSLIYHYVNVLNRAGKIQRNSTRSRRPRSDQALQHRQRELGPPATKRPAKELEALASREQL